MHITDTFTFSFSLLLPHSHSSLFRAYASVAVQIAAKITPAGSGDAQGPGIKRPMDDGASFGKLDHFSQIKTKHSNSSP